MTAERQQKRVVSHTNTRKRKPFCILIEEVSKKFCASFVASSSTIRKLMTSCSLWRRHSKTMEWIQIDTTHEREKIDVAKKLFEIKHSIGTFLLAAIIIVYIHTCDAMKKAVVFCVEHHVSIGP